MKASKFFAVAMAAVMAVGFASCDKKNEPNKPGGDVVIDPKPVVATPELTDLPDAKDGGYVLAFKFEGQVCNDIVFAGNYNEWNTAEAVKMTKLAGFDGWYVVSVAAPADGEEGPVALQGKPVQLDGEGKFSWDYQTGDENSWTVEAGEVDIKAGYSGESDLTYNTKKAVLVSKDWKNGNNPCVEKKVFAKVTFNLEIKGDAQEAVYLHGPFVDEGWNGIEMTKVDGNHFTIEVENLAEKTEYQYTLAADNWDAKAVFEAEGEAGSGNQMVTAEVMNDVVYNFLP